MCCTCLDIGYIWEQLPYSRYDVCVSTDLDVFMNLDCMDKYWNTYVMYVYKLCGCGDFMWCRQIDRQIVLLNYDVIVEHVNCL